MGSACFNRTKTSENKINGGRISDSPIASISSSHCSASCQAGSPLSSDYYFVRDLIIAARQSASLVSIWSSTSLSVCQSYISASRPHESRQFTQRPCLRCHAVPHRGQKRGSCREIGTGPPFIGASTFGFMIQRLHFVTLRAWWKP